MSNYNQGFHGQQNYKSQARSSAFKIYHSANSQDTIIILNSDFCKAIHDTLLSNFCDNKAIVAFAKQLIYSNNVQENHYNKKQDNRSYQRSNISYGNNINYQSKSHQRMHPADVEDYLDHIDE